MGLLFTICILSLGIHLYKKAILAEMSVTLLLHQADDTCCHIKKSLCVKYLNKMHSFVLKILNGDRIQMSSKGHKAVVS